ncbi:probable insulin-like peptide 3 [Episyrphus balteatus]|uniref:probable insulin-like peptide 3 n=1 Tax=Episyrphus balteatus TaxID=286459 RepID=UPI0024869FD8|nr:probable insulin-like peptide 3 [Episyrphus balteatus]
MSFNSSVKILFALNWFCLLMIIGFNTPSCEGVQKLCGKKLPDTLDLICENGFGTKTKKSIDPVDYYNDIEEGIQLPFDQFPFISKFEANALAKSRRRRFGIADECCKKACTMAELRSYCL